MPNIHEETNATDLRNILSNFLPADKEILLWWLGQGGFAFRFDDVFGLIDPYLSDSLAKKYRGKEFPHVRMMQPPVLPEEIHDLDMILCTHGHTDHLDPETVSILARNNPNCRFILPKAEIKPAVGSGIPVERITGMNAGDLISPVAGISITAIPSAHEELKTNENGEHYFLGYIIKLGDTLLYHAGDCVPYPGLAEELSGYDIGFALLPVNGRDEYRRNRNILGNFTAAEAAGLCVEAGIPMLIGHHFGMFDFNTVETEEIERAFKQVQENCTGIIPRTGVTYHLTK